MPVRPKQQPPAEIRRRIRAEPPAPPDHLPKQDDYEVGYGRPPKDTRFRKGTSGNPKGRPKGGRGLKQIVDTQLNEVVSFRMNGRAAKGTKLELIVLQLSQKALSGDMRAAERLIKLSQQYQDEPEAERAREALTPAEMDERDKALLAEFLPLFQNTKGQPS